MVKGNKENRFLYGLGVVVSVICMACIVTLCIAFTAWVIMILF